MRPALASLFAALLFGCASDFNPSLKQTGDESTISEDDGEDASDNSADDGEDGGSEDPGDTDSGEPGSSDDAGSSDDSGESEDSGSDDSSDTSDTDEPVTPPEFGEPCDPFLAFNGVAPCQADPAYPQIPSTCVLVQDQVELTWQFECVSVKDTQGDGEDLSDPCSDAGGDPFAGCLNSFCLSNGLGSYPETDVYQNHPPIPSDEACPFIWWSEDDPNHEGGGYYVQGCCSSFCDAAHPCEAGWTCDMSGLVPAELNGEEVGVCVWA